MTPINTSSPYFTWNQDAKRKGRPYAVTFYSVNEAKAWFSRTNERNCELYDISMPTATRVGQSLSTGGKAFANIVIKLNKGLAV